MELREILAISGQSGLFKFVAQNKGGIIIESLADGKRSLVPSTAKVSALGEIAIFTASDDLPLADVFDSLFKLSDGKASIDPKTVTADQLKAKFAEVLPDYDRDRVHVSDMKKVFAWYNLLQAAGMTKFKEEPAEGEKEE